MNKRDYFLKIFHMAEKHYGSADKRLAADGWNRGWQTLIATIMSAQTRDEVTIPVAERLFARYPTVETLSRARVSDVLRIIKPINFSPRKARYVVASARSLREHHGGKVPDSIEALVQMPGVGRKTANLVLSEVHKKDAICIDTHCQRLLNVLGIVKTKNPAQTEREMMKIAPRKYWSRINRILVLWGKDVRGRSKEKFLAKLKE